MTDHARPSTNALIAHVADDATAQIIVDALTADHGVDADDIEHGSGPDFAARLEAGDPDSAPASRFLKWVLSLGQEREELIRLGDVVREGRHGIVVSHVTDDGDRDAIAAVLTANGAKDVVYFGSWQTEDMSINR